MISCFFCQNLLTDYDDQMLPVKKHEEVKDHLSGCESCRSLLSSLKELRENLRREKDKNSESFYERWQEASSKTQVTLLRRFRDLKAWSKVSLFSGFLLLGFYFSKMVLVTWFNPGRGDDSSQFSRYFPLLQGAQEIVEEQSAFLQFRDNLAANMWEEGGISPEEFEKNFPSSKGDDASDSSESIKIKPQ